jgi:hypothetical protein
MAESEDKPAAEEEQAAAEPEASTDAAPAPESAAEEAAPADASDEQAEGAVADAEGKDEAPAEPELPAESEVTPLKKSAPKDGSALAKVNLLLVLAICAFLGLSGFEIYANATLKPLSLEGPADGGLPPALARFDLRPIEDVLKSFGERDIFATFDESAGTAGTKPAEGGKVEVVRVVKTRWETELAQLKLSAFFGQPPNLGAVLVDSKEGRIRLLQKGSRFVFLSKELFVEEVMGDRLVVTDGAKKMVIR